MTTSRARSTRPAVLALLAAAALVLAAVAWRQWGGTPDSILAMPLDSPARPGTEAVEWCTGQSPAGGYGPVIQVGRTYLGMQRPLSDTGAAGLHDDPLFPAACSLAYEMWGLSGPEWDWCFNVDNRAAWLDPSIKLLGLGTDEAAGTETFGEAPGDNPAEYVQACRFAYRYVRPANAIPTIDDARMHPFFALSTDATAWCTANPDRLESAAHEMDIGPQLRADAAEVPEREAYVRACRFARILDAAHA